MSSKAGISKGDNDVKVLVPQWRNKTVDVVKDDAVKNVYRPQF